MLAPPRASQPQRHQPYTHTHSTAIVSYSATSDTIVCPVRKQWGSSWYVCAHVWVWEWDKLTLLLTRGRASWTRLWVIQCVFYTKGMHRISGQKARVSKWHWWRLDCRANGKATEFWLLARWLFSRRIKGHGFKDQMHLTDDHFQTENMN